MSKKFQTAVIVLMLIALLGSSAAVCIMYIIG